MNILYLTTGCFDKGGVSRYCRYQAQALRELFGDANVSVMSLLGPDGSGFETSFETHWHGGRGRLWDKARFSQHALRRSFATRPDVVHVAHLNMGPLAIHAARIAGAVLVLNVYGLEIWSGLSTARRRAMRRMNRIMADCHFTSSYVVEESMHVARPDVIWDCVDLDRFTPAECPSETLRKYGLPDKRACFVIMSLGRLSVRAAHKGYDRLLRVFASLAPEVPQARLVIAGKGDDLERLRALASELGVRDRVVFPGAVPEADLADVYRAATIFSLVSDRGTGRGEGIPLTPLEAMACAVPIIVGNQDGSSEAVFGDEGGEANGYAIDPFDQDNHVAKILRLARAPDLLERMRRSARRVAEERFGYERFVREHAALYADLGAGQAYACS